MEQPPDGADNLVDGSEAASSSEILRLFSKSAWREALGYLGPDAYLALAVLDRDRRENPVLKPEGALRGMTRRHVQGKLNLLVSIDAIRKRPANLPNGDDCLNGLNACSRQHPVHR